MLGLLAAFQNHVVIGKHVELRATYGGMYFSCTSLKCKANISTAGAHLEVRNSSKPLTGGV